MSKQPPNIVALYSFYGSTIVVPESVYGALSTRVRPLTTLYPPLQFSGISILNSFIVNLKSMPSC